MAFNELLERQRRETEELKITLDKRWEQFNSERAFVDYIWNQDYTSAINDRIVWNPLMWTTTTTTTNTF